MNHNKADDIKPKIINVKEAKSFESTDIVSL